MAACWLKFSKVSSSVTVRTWWSSKLKLRISLSTRQSRSLLCFKNCQNSSRYGVATVSRIDKIIGLFCRIASVFQGSFAKETYNFMDPTSQSHPIPNLLCVNGLYSGISKNSAYKVKISKTTVNFKSKKISRFFDSAGTKIRTLYRTNWFALPLSKNRLVHVDSLFLYLLSGPFIDLRFTLGCSRQSFMFDMTHSYVRHGSFVCATWLIHMCDMTHSYVRHDSFMCVSWLNHVCAMTHSYV